MENFLEENEEGKQANKRPGSLTSSAEKLILNRTGGGAGRQRRLRRAAATPPARRGACSMADKARTRQGLSSSLADNTNYQGTNDVKGKAKRRNKLLQDLNLRQFEEGIGGMIGGHGRTRISLPTTYRTSERGRAGGAAGLNRSQ